MGLGIASGFGAGAAGNALTDILKQKFIEQIQKAKLAEDIRQADMANTVAQGRLGIERGGLDLGRQKLGEDVRQFDVGAGFKGREIGMQEQAQPLKLKQIGAATAQDEAQTAEIQRRPTAEAEQRTFQTGRDSAQHGYRMGEIGAQGANALRVAQERPAPTFLAPSVDEHGNPTMTVTPKVAGTVVAGKPDKETAQTMQMAETARDIIPHISTVRSEADQLNKLGLLGPIQGRFRDFVAGKIGAGQLAGGNPEAARLIGKFQADMGLLQTAVARAHAGARGAGNVTLLKHMESIMPGGVADLPTFLGSMDAVEGWMQTYAEHGKKSGGTAGPETPGTVPGNETPAQRLARLKAIAESK
jgi:hypothetical protein